MIALCLVTQNSKCLLYNSVSKQRFFDDAFMTFSLVLHEVYYVASSCNCIGKLKQFYKRTTAYTVMQSDPHYRPLIV